jgi:hypothetical protein
VDNYWITNNKGAAIKSPMHSVLIKFLVEKNPKLILVNLKRRGIS